MPDPLTERWIAGWVAMRGLDISELDGWPLIHVQSASRRSELICIDPGVEALHALLPHIAGDAAAMLTVVGPDLSAYRAMSMPDGVRVDRDDETLMVAAVERSPATPLPEGLVATWEIDDRVTHYRLEDGDRVVSEGDMGLHDGWATIDSVETSRTHQRRGLGRHVMSALLTHAHRAGARDAVLAATADGRALYASMGWRVERELLSLMGTPPPGAVT